MLLAGFKVHTLLNNFIIISFNAIPMMMLEKILLNKILTKILRKEKNFLCNYNKC